MQKLRTEELNRKTIEEFKQAKKNPVMVVLDNLRSQHNIGSIFRTCDAFLMEGIYLCGITATPPHREIHKTALGATNSVVWKYYPTTLEAVDALKRQGYYLLAVEQTLQSCPLSHLPLSTPEKYALVFGNEVQGIDPAVLDLCHASVEIPQCGTKHSLNVAVSAGIVLWEFFKQYQNPNP
jgi:tRNA G18 (ribose-2'-O)-methylase SpoU